MSSKHPIARSSAARWTPSLAALPALSVRQPWAWLIVNDVKEKPYSSDSSPWAVADTRQVMADYAAYGFAADVSRWTSSAQRLRSTCVPST
jgi:hypothetical protein